MLFILSYSPSLFLSVRLMPRHVRKSVMLQPLLLLVLRGRILRWWGEKLISYCLFLISYDITSSSFFFILLFLLHFTSLNFIFIISFRSSSPFHLFFLFYFPWCSLISSFYFTFTFRFDSLLYSPFTFFHLVFSSFISRALLSSHFFFSHLISSLVLISSPLSPIFSSVSAWCGCCST